MTITVDSDSATWSLRCSGADLVLDNAYFRLEDHERRAIKNEWKQLGFYAAAEHKIPTGLPMCDIESRAVYPASRPGPVPDTPAWSQMMKAVKDGLVHFGVWPDDNPTWCRFELFAPAMKSPRVDVPTLVICLHGVR